jgi:organic hydroperoxide reductase OsmC/OhrA
MNHIFVSHLDWAGAASGPTRDVATFSRDLNVTMGPFTLPMSSAPAFQGDPLRGNPEQLFVASLAACQALTYLYLAAKNHVPVVGYSDDALGHLEKVEKRMRMSRVVLRPQIVLEPGADLALASALVEQAHASCFIANSVSAIVTIEPTVRVAQVTVATVH